MSINEKQAVNFSIDSKSNKNVTPGLGKSVKSSRKSRSRITESVAGQSLQKQSVKMSDGFNSSGGTSE